jgi:hypothetical protein
MKCNLCKVLVSNSSKHLEKLETCTLALRFITNCISLSYNLRPLFNFGFLSRIWFSKQARVIDKILQNIQNFQAKN